MIAFSILKAGCLIWIGAIGLWSVVAGLRQAWQLTRQNIRTTQGVILSSRVASGQNIGRVERKSTFYWPVVSFAYEVDGEPHTGDRISIAVVRTSNESQVVRKLRCYPKGALTRVFYDASKPWESWLVNPRRHVATALAFVAAITLVMAGLCWMICGFVE